MRSVKYRMGSAALLLGLLAACTGAGDSRGVKASKPQEVRLIASVTPVYGETVRQGDTVRIACTLEKDAAPDSVVLSMNGKRIQRVDTAGYTYVTRRNHPVGRMIYTLTAYRGEGSQRRSGEFTVLAAVPPVLYGYRVKAAYPHDRRAYTQGLFHHDGYLYESTGVLGQSSLRKVDIPTGEVLQNHDLPRDYFGEGLALLNGKLYQLTWQNNMALVYDLKTFGQLKEFTYPGEGWGITTDGTYLYMSDGTEKIAVLDPGTFRPVRSVEVYTDRNSIPYINELEWIDGEIWANIYTTDNIVRIDPETGAVTGVVDMSGLLSPTDMGPDTDVLNGIAYDVRRRRIFVTGKNWNKLFEVEVFRK